MQNLQGNGHAVPSSSPSRHPNHSNHSNHSSHSSHSSLSRQDTPPPPSGSTHPTAPRILGPMGSLGIPVRQAPGFQAMQSSAFDDDVRAQAHPLPARVQRQGIKRERKEARDEAPIERVIDKKAKAARPTIRQASDSEEPPPLELGPPAALTDAKSSPAIDTKAAPDRRVQAARDAMDIPSLVRLSGPAREEALAQRQAVLDAWAQDLARTERLARFDRFGHQLCLSTPATPEEAAAVDLSLLGARAVVRHMTALQRQAALRAACAVPVSVQDITGVHRRIRLISLYEAMDAATRETEAAALRRDSDLIDMDPASMKRVVKVRAEQFSALGHLLTPAQRRAELAQLRQPGRLLHMDATARTPALELLAARFWGAMTGLSPDELREEQALAVAMTQGLQEMAETPWQRTLELRQVELFQNCRLTALAAVPSLLREAVVPTALADLRGPALERGLALRKLLVLELMARLPPQDRDRALADAQDPATLADYGGMTLEIAIRLRKLVFEDYFKTLPPTSAATTAGQVERASALDTSGLASQPEAQALRSALLRLALVDAASHTVAPAASHSSSSFRSSSPSVQWR